MTAFRLVPHVVRAFHVGRQQWVWAQMATPTLDIAAMPNWPDLLAEGCREAEGRIAFVGVADNQWQPLIPERAFSQVN